MPNGNDLTDEEYRQLDEPLRRIDETLVDFGRRITGEVWRDHHGHPYRWLRLRRLGDIERSIHLSPFVPSGNYADASQFAYQLSTSMWRDKGRVRESLSQRIATISADQMNPNTIATFLEKAMQKLQSVDAVMFASLATRTQLSPVDAKGYLPPSGPVN
jgi:hypothetical protein